MTPPAPDIPAALENIERRFGVRVLFASESGSRSWGFSNELSDFDAHFIYERLPGCLAGPKDTLGPPNEIPIDSLGQGLDISGWELKKAVEHAASSNPLLWDWLDSPLIHFDPHGWGDRFREAFAPFRSDRAMAGVHYAIAMKNLKDMAKSDQARSKRYFHIARPILCCQWLQRRPGSLPPADFEALLRALPPPSGALEEIEALLYRKRQAPFEERSSRLPALEAWARGELASIDRWIPSIPRHRPDPAPLQEFLDRSRALIGAQIPDPATAPAPRPRRG